MPTVDQPMRPFSNSEFYSASTIGLAANVHARTILRRAARGRWPRKRSGNTFLFRPPRGLRGECAEFERVIHIGRAHYAPTATDGLRSDHLTPACRAEAVRLANRISAVLKLAKVLDGGEGREAALVRVAKAASFKCSPRQLRRWWNAIAKDGVVGLIERKRGRPTTKLRAIA